MSDFRENGASYSNHFNLIRVPDTVSAVTFDMPLPSF